MSEDTGYINKVALTTRPNEIALGCEKGLFFGVLDNNNKFIYNENESYFDEKQGATPKLISQVFEFAPDKLIVADYFDHGFYIIDRSTQGKQDIQEIQN
jgi:hypothetical protein